MPSRDFSASTGRRGVDLAETRRRILFACEHLAANAPAHAQRRPSGGTFSRTGDGDLGGHRTSSEHAA
ncbi:MAG: hypothetical protein QOE86_2287 [Solirubrobacteraceae bacterium]|jgi:hypothetical protein|nr:hypothetical protein [Solirubrobacteraceae bacterium]